MAGCAFLATMVTESLELAANGPDQWKLWAPRRPCRILGDLWIGRGHDMKHEMSDFADTPAQEGIVRRRSQSVTKTSGWKLGVVDNKLIVFIINSWSGIENQGINVAYRAKVLTIEQFCSKGCSTILFFEPFYGLSGEAFTRSYSGHSVSGHIEARGSGVSWHPGTQRRTGCRLYFD